jgi:hypothetical protein
MSALADDPETIAQTAEGLMAARAANAQQERDSDLEVQMMETGLRRALVHMDVSSYSILKGKQEKLD